MKPMELYRKGIVAVIINDQNQVLIFERADWFGSWQFPQGGIEKGETATEAFFRELQEEIGSNQCDILKIAQRPTRYEWPRSHNHFVGQEQTWFLARFKAGELPHLENSDRCFRQYKWASPEEALSLLIEWKRPAFKMGLSLLGLLASEART
jgi:putative (di)nucleoside polyphosphate hydrolase